MDSNNKTYKFQEKVKAYGIVDFLTMFKECDLELKEKFGDYNLNSEGKAVIDFLNINYVLNNLIKYE